MTTTTLKNRLQKNFKGSKNTVAYKIITDVLENTNKSGCYFKGLIRPVYTSGRGRFTSNLDYTLYVCQILDLLKVKYITGNDSPRCGKTGNFIQIKTKIENI